MDIKVWVGCLAHYNNGDLIGAWMDAEDAPTWVCPQRNPDDIYINCEETWVMDHEIPGVSGEMDPMTAGKWAEVFAEIDEDQADAFRAYLSQSDETNPSDELVEAFRASYRGEWDSERAFALNYFEEMHGTTVDEYMPDHYSGYGHKVKRIPEVFTDHFDWDSYARELFSDFSMVNGHVFSDH